MSMDAGTIVRKAKGRGLLDAGADTVLNSETQAAQQSLETGIYISFLPSPYATVPASACDDIRAGASQCCRIGDLSLCRCGHALAEHESVKMPKRKGYVKPPKCMACKRCPSFSYSPMYPEECGQWWLRRRRDFNLQEWRKVLIYVKSAITLIICFMTICKRVQAHPEDYACIGCNLKLDDHETVWETRDDRLLRHAAVDTSYVPLEDYRAMLAADVDPSGLSLASASINTSTAVSIDQGARSYAVPRQVRK